MLFGPQIFVEMSKDAFANWRDHNFTMKEIKWSFKSSPCQYLSMSGNKKINASRTRK